VATNKIQILECASIDLLFVVMKWFLLRWVPSITRLRASLLGHASIFDARRRRSPSGVDSPLALCSFLLLLRCFPLSLRKGGVWLCHSVGLRRRLRFPTWRGRRVISGDAALPRFNPFAVFKARQIALDDCASSDQVGKSLADGRKRNASLPGDLQVEPLTVLLQAL